MPRLLSPLAAQLLMALAGFGCAVDSQPADSTPEQAPTAQVAEGEASLIKEYLGASGFDTTKLEIDEDLSAVVLDGDMALNLDEVRDGLYADKGYDFFGVTAKFNTPSGPVTPYTIRKIDADLIGDIKLVFETPANQWWATEPVNDFWKAAFRNAAQQWSNSNSRIRIGESNGGGGRGATLSIILTTRAFCDKNGDGINDCLAMAAAPGYGFPGHYILLDPTVATGCTGNYVPPGCSGGGCFVRMIHVALHEMGHTLGFAHTGCFNRIAGTATDNSCDSSGAYASQMVSNINCNDNGLLKSDDILSASKVYPR